MHAGHPVCYLVLLLMLASLFSCEQKAPQRNVLLITIDTLRADRLGCYGSRKVKTPNIDSFAEGGTLFEEVIAPTPLTLPSHASILTGQYPAEHGIRDNGFYRLPDGYPTLAAALGDEKYRTAAFVASGTLNAIFGLDQGFGSYSDMSRGKRTSLKNRAQRKAGEVNEEAISWLKSEAREPFFLWVHYFDPHSPYAPPEEYRKEYNHPYDGEVAYTDSEVGKLLKALKEAGLESNTLTVITADHGEALGDHGEESHGIFLYRPTMRVPLIFSGPGIPEGKRISIMSRLIDICPTVLEYTGNGEGFDCSGKSLLPVILGKAIPEANPSYIETEGPANLMGWSPLKGLRTATYKYIAPPAKELYDIRHDPKEKINLIKKEGKLARKLSKEMKRIASTFPEDTRSEIFPDSTMRQKLESLGYVGQKASGASEKDAPNPGDMIDVLNYYQRANRKSESGDFEEALKICKKALERDHSNHRILHIYAYSLHNSGKLEKSAKVYEKLLDMDPRIIAARSDIAAVYAKLGRHEQALASAKQAIKMDPGNEEPYYTLGAVYEMKEKTEKAVQNYRQVLELNPNHYLALKQLGNILVKESSTKEEGQRLIKRAEEVKKK